VRSDSTGAHGCVQCSVKRGELARAITWDTVGTVLRADQHCGVLVELRVIALIHRDYIRVANFVRDPVQALLFEIVVLPLARIHGV
jgi:hypothetical protein